MFNVFHWYFFGRRVTSYFVAISSFLVGIYLLRRYPLHISVMLSMSLCSLGHAIYDTVFIYSAKAWRDVTLLGIFRIIGTTTILSMMHDRYEYLKFNKLSIILVVGWLATHLGLYITGFYTAVSEWNYTLLTNFPATDPHNWLSALNMAFGFWMLLPLAYRREKEL